MVNLKKLTYIECSPSCKACAKLFQCLVLFDHHDPIPIPKEKTESSIRQPAKVTCLVSVRWMGAGLCRRDIVMILFSPRLCPFLPRRPPVN